MLLRCRITPLTHGRPMAPWPRRHCSYCWLGNRHGDDAGDAAREEVMEREDAIGAVVNSRGTNERSPRSQCHMLILLSVEAIASFLAIPEPNSDTRTEGSNDAEHQTSRNQSNTGFDRRKNIA
jgi:hypothetical protein